MAVIDTIPTTTVTVPTALHGANNGQLPADWLRSFDGTTRTDYKMFAPVSYAMQAMHLAALEDGVELRTTGRYRSYARQVALFRERYQTDPISGRPRKWWNGQWWYQKVGVAMAATPGTSNHGLGLADDVAAELDDDPAVESVDAATLAWLRDNAADFGFGLETRKEAWHWHWISGDRLTQSCVDILAGHAIPLPELSGWLFTAPAPTTNQEDDDMTPEQATQLKAVHDALLVQNPTTTEKGMSIVHQATQTHVIMRVLWDGFPGTIVDGAGVIARTIKNIATKVGAKVG